MKRLVALAAVPLLAMSMWGSASAQDTGKATGKATGKVADDSNGFLMELWGITPEVQKNPVAYGGKLVEHLGCLYCHGLGGRQGIDNPNAVRKYVPSWDSKEFVERYPTSEKVRETIRNGRFPDKDPKADSSPIPMPPWGNRLDDHELDAIIAYIWSLRSTPVAAHPKGGLGTVQTAEESAPESPLTGLPKEPQEEPAEHVAGTKPPGADNPVRLGHDLVEHLGCLYCHGLGGRQGIENPNAVRKHVPSWDSPEFIQRYPVDDGVRYVIEKGRVPQRDPKADGSPIPMPPWGNRLKPDEMDAIVAYIWSLRSTPMATHEKGGRGSQE